MTDLAQMVQDHNSRFPLELNKMVSHAYSDEQKEMDEKADWKKMQNIRVIARFRPTNKVEKEYSRKKKVRDIPPNINNNIITLTTVDLKSKENASGIPPRSMIGLSRRKQEKRMQYRSVLDHVFNTNTTQKPVFKIVGQPLINAALNGFNATLFAYGQTGSGKTYSMFGANDDGSGTDLQAMGLIPRSFVYLFDRLEQRCRKQTIQNFAVTIQTLQIYNKRLLDLLNPNSKTKLEIKTDFSKDCIFIKHLRTIQITSAREALAVLIEASRSRIVAGHALNEHSSRSHMLVLLKIKQIRIDGSSTTANINFGDLAGSENIAKAHGKTSKGRSDEAKAIDNKRRKEGISINASLSALTRCINSLVKGEHPGYRDSPLTHVLQDSLGGNSKTTLLVCASPHVFNRNETIRTLRFAATAKEVKNKAKMNQTLSVKALQKKIRELTAENAQLKTELAIARGKMKNATGRRLVVSFEHQLPDAEPQLFPHYSNAPVSPLSRANIPMHPDQTARLLGVDNIFNQSVHNSNDSVHNSNDMNGSVNGDLNALTAAVSIAEHQMVIESEEYMTQISNLNEQLQKEVENSKELNEKTERQIKELDKAESTINYLRSENDDKVLKIYNQSQELDKLQKQLAELKFVRRDYQQMFPEYKPKQYNENEDDNSDIDRAGGAMHMEKNSMDIQVETLEKYLATMCNTQTDLSQVTDQIKSNIQVLPEIRAEFTEKYEKTTEFYDDITKKTHDLQSQISSMRFILQNLAKNYDEDREERIELGGNYNQSMSVVRHAHDDENDLYDGRRNRDNQKNQQIANDIIESKSDCWSKIFYCGEDNDKQIKRDIENDRQVNINGQGQNNNRFQNEKRLILSSRNNFKAVLMCKPPCKEIAKILSFFFFY